MSLEAPLEDSMTIMHWQVDEPGVIRKVGSMQGQLIDGILVSINFEKNTNILMLSKKNMISRYHVPNWYAELSTVNLFLSISAQCVNHP
jgi:hypothetical protein